MAELKILLQGLSKNDDHETAINKLLSIPDIDNCLFSLAFVRRNGVESIKSNLKTIGNRATVFIGIRNGITSVQGILSLLEVGISPFVVDTASSKILFHPKIYTAYNKINAHVILGSSNLTLGGLSHNIEASSYIKLDRSLENDESYLIKLISTMFGLPSKYPDHVFQVNNVRKAINLLREGRLEDERLVRMPVSNIIKEKNGRDTLNPIKTHGKKKQILIKGIKRGRVKTTTHKAALVWESKPLTARSLNIQQKENTHITGDTNLGAGLMKNIDFRHYFRNVVFSGLNWRTSSFSKNSHLERATLNAEIIIQSISFGMHKLDVTHDPRINTKSYHQKNVMTKIRWGNARDIIANESLLKCTLRLYQKDSTTYIIVID